MWGQHGLETGPSFPLGPRDRDGGKVLRFDPDLLEHEVELGGAGSCLPFGAKGQEVTVTQLQPVSPWESDIIDQSPLAAVILQADPPVVPLEFSMQLCMDPRDEARLLCWGRRATSHRSALQPNR